MSRCTTSAIAAALLCAVTAAAQTVVSGTLRGVTRWSGKVTVTGDVNIVKSARLEIEAGTVVTIAPRDGTKGGWNPDRVEIHVQGQLLVEGHVEGPVRFVVDDGRGDKAPAQPGVGSKWHGIVLHERGDEDKRRNIVRGAQVLRAFAGIQVPAGSPLLEDCVFLGCGTGVEVGSAYRDEQFQPIDGGFAAPELHRCRFTDCYTGLYAQGHSVPILDRCVFHDCTNGVGPRRRGVTGFLDDPGCRLEHCGFVGVGSAVNGSSFVRDSWFEDCVTVLRLSPYHDRIATQIEQVVFERNLVHGEKRFVVGDTAVARAALRGELRLRGPTTELAAPWPPLPDCLQLQEGSAAVGKALHGLDVGPASGGGGQQARLKASLPGALLRGGLALPIDPPKRWARIEEVTPGATRGKGWWGAVLQEQNGALYLRRVLGTTRSSGLLAFEFAAAAAGEAKLHWTGDIAELEFAIGGKVVGAIKGRRRFGADNEPVAFPHDAGRVLLLVRVEGWGNNPRIAVSLEGGLTVVPLPAVESVDLEARAKVSKRRRDLFVEVTFRAPVHWSPTAGANLALVQIGNARPTFVKTEWVKPRLLRLGPMQGVKARTELTVSFPGICDVLGRPIACESVMVRAR